MWTEKENKVLKVLQVGIPLELEPFRAIARNVGISEEETLEIVRSLKERRIIRRISPIYDTRMLGYDSALVVFKVDPYSIETAASIVSKHPGVSHNYERGHEYNLWFTLATPPDSRFGLERTVEILADIARAQHHIIFRTRRLFKIGVKLDFGGTTLEREEVGAKKLRFTPLTEKEKHIIRATQEDIRLSKRPFTSSAKVLEMKEEEVIEKLREFKQRGVMRRFAAILNHRKAGFLANGLLVSHVAEDGIEKIGYRIASFKAVSHCYERVSSPTWKYNLFSMIHGMDREEVEEVVKEIIKDTGLKDYEVLYSSREFKKRRVRYFTEELHDWEKDHISHFLSRTSV
jgi:DNA-binding Lrp family transcriptional regulator